MRKGVLSGFIFTAFIILLVIAVIDAVKGGITSSDGTLWTRSLKSLLEFMQSLNFGDNISWTFQYWELGEWPSWIDWALTIVEVLGTILNYVVSLIILATQALVYVFGIIAWVFV